ncbi:MAG: ABC transporter permease [Xanthobacteraceae bacterium]|jgi:putative spermidine/putrescine transport system permease protein
MTNDTPAHFSPGVLSKFYVNTVIFFLIVPILVGIVVAFTSGDRMEFPIPGVSLRWFYDALSKPQFIEGLLNSLIIALCSAVLATIAGTGAAIALNQYDFVGRTLIRAAVMMPIVIPGILVGLSLLFTLSSYGMEPGLLASTIGHAVVGIPYVVAMVLAALANYDRSLELASLNLGVGPVGTFMKITLPLIKGGVMAGGITAFLISFDNISVSLFTARGDTLPLRLLQQLRGYIDPSVAAISTLLIIGSLVLLALLLPFVMKSR